MGFGNSEQNFGMIASKFTVAMWYTDRPPIQVKRLTCFNKPNLNLALLFCFHYICLNVKRALAPLDT